MKSLKGAVLFAAAAAAWVPEAGAMGYDSLACPELAERRLAYFTQNGFCAPGTAPDKTATKPCAPIDAQSLQMLPEADRTQVEMIVRTEARKSCPGA